MRSEKGDVFMYETKSCFNSSCNTKFMPVRSNQLFCNPTCRSKYYYKVKQYSKGKEYNTRENINCQDCWERMRKKSDKYICPKCGKTFQIDSLGKVVYKDISK